MTQTFEFEASYDPDVLEEITPKINTPTEMSITFPDGANYLFQSKLKGPAKRIKIPSNWFQKFKIRWFPNWVCLIFPIKYRTYYELTYEVEENP